MRNLTNNGTHDYLTDSPMHAITGTSNPLLVSKIVDQLDATSPTLHKFAHPVVKRFSDGEIFVELTDSVRGAPVVIVQSTSYPANDTLMELLLLVDAARRASADRIIACIPYFGYARQDRRPGFQRMPITARLVADMLETAGVDQVVTMDLHAAQIQGFFHIPVDNITAMPLFAADVAATFDDQEIVVVSPDVGGVARARMLAKLLGDAPLTIIDKRRPSPNQSEIMNIIGDVRGKTCIMVDDMIDTAGTICKGADALKRAGAKTVVAYATHGVLSGDAHINIMASLIDAIIVTDTIHHVSTSGKVRTLSTAQLFAETIIRAVDGQSITALMTQ